MKFDQETEAFARSCPKTWEVISGRRYLLPNYRQADYANQVHLINEYVQYLEDLFAGAFHATQERLSTHFSNIAIALSHNRPTYFLEREVGEMFCRTNLPPVIEPQSIKWKFPHMRIMLPSGLLDVGFKTKNIALPYLDIFRLDLSKTIKFPSVIGKELDACGAFAKALAKIGAPPAAEWRSVKYPSDGVGICVRVRDPESGDTCVQSVVAHWDQIQTDRINQALNLEGFYRTDEELFLKVQHIALNILLFLSSSPEDYKFLPEVVRPSRIEGKHFISGLYQAKFIGDSQRKYLRQEPQIITDKKSKKQSGVGSPHAGHWVAGHWRNQSIGPRDSPSTKLILIYPYFAEGNKNSLNGESVATA